MKKIFLILVSFVCVLSQAQTQHMVRRGETPQTIAQKYNITVDQLFDANPAVRGYIHVGLSLNIPQNEMAKSFNSNEPDNSNKSEIDNSSEYNSDLDKTVKELTELLKKQDIIDDYWEQASSAFKRKDYREAERLYSKVIELDSKDADAYFNRGACFYNRGKYKQAKENFYTSYNLYTDGDSKEKARKLYKESEELQREKSQRVWGIAATVALAAAGTAVAVSEAQQKGTAQQSFGYSPAYQSSYGNYSMPNTLSSSQYPESAALQAYSNQLMESSMREINKTQEITMITNQVLMENGVNPNSVDDQAKLRAGFVNHYKQSFGINPSQEEIQKFMYDYQMIKYEVVLKMNNSDDDNTDSENLPSSTSNSNKYQAEYDFYERLVRNSFSSIVAIGGVEIKEDNKETRIKADSHAPAGANQSLYFDIIENQKKMTEIRNEARRNGVKIIASEWENKTLGHF